MDKKHLTINIVIQAVVFFLLIAADRATKLLAAAFLKGQSDINLISDKIVLHYIENEGAAFGIFKNNMLLFYLFTIVILLVIIILFVLISYRLYKYMALVKEDLNEKTCRNMIFLNYILIVLAAGAAGNLIDRIDYGYVIDFIYFRFIDFPVFNIADICVTVSAFLIVIFFIFVYKEDSNFRLFRSEKE